MTFVLVQDAEWDPWKFTHDEDAVQFARDEQYVYFWILDLRRVVRKDAGGNCHILINRRNS
jgi:hypothetical protein